MVIHEKEVTLNSGRKVTIYPLGVRQRAKLKDQAYGAFNRGIRVSLENCLDACIMGLGMKEEAFNTWQDEEIYECGGLVMESMIVNKTDKKKSKLQHGHPTREEK